MDKPTNNGLAEKKISEAVDRDNSYEARSDAMLQYFLSKLNVRVQMLEERGYSVHTDDYTDTSAPTPEKDHTGRGTTLGVVKDDSLSLRQAKKGRYTEDSAWTEAYRLERLLASIEPEESVIAEIERRLSEASSLKISAEPAFRAELQVVKSRAANPKGEKVKLEAPDIFALRVILVSILEEIHWANRRKFYARPLQQDAASRLVRIGGTAFLLFLLPYIFYYILGLDEPPNYWQSLPLWTALSASLLGAIFSRLLWLQRNGEIASLNELERAKQTWPIVLRLAVGTCGGLIIFIFLRSGLIGGGLTPDMNMLGILKPTKNETELIFVGGMPTAGLALLAMWGFVAGFSERLVPSLLSSTEERLKGAGTAS